jgi:hypothetical protein
MGGLQMGYSGLHVARPKTIPAKNRVKMLTADFRERHEMGACLTLCPRCTLLMRFHSIEDSEEPEAFR